MWDSFFYDIYYLRKFNTSEEAYPISRGSQLSVKCSSKTAERVFFF